MSLLPIILQLIIPLIQANNNNNNNNYIPPPTAPPPPPPKPQPLPTQHHNEPPHHHHHHHLGQSLFPSSSLFSFPFDYSGFYNNFLPFYDYSVFYDPFLPFRTYKNVTATGRAQQRNTNKKKTLKNRKNIKLFRTYKTFSPKRGSERVRKSKSIQKKRRKIPLKGKRKRVPMNKKRKKSQSTRRRPIAFRKRLKVPGKAISATISTPDLMRGIQIRYRGKSYRLSLPQFFSLFKRKIPSYK